MVINRKCHKADWQLEMGRWLNRLRWKTAWRNYQNDLISYGTFYWLSFDIVNRVRVERGNEPYSEKKFDEAWQYRVLCHENYKVAYDEMINVIFGWW